MKLLSTIIKRISIVIFVIVCVAFVIDKSLSKKTNQTSLTGDIYLIESNSPWNLYFTATGTTTFKLRQQLESETKQSCTVINGGYFGYTASGDFQPAGSLTMTPFENNIKVIDSSIDIIGDKNLTTILRYQKHGGWTIDIKKNPVYDSHSYYNFYAGPIIIKDSYIFSGDIAESTHGKGNYYRTFIARFQGGKSYMGITTSPMTLYELGGQLQSSLSGVDFVVNLDGGPSTSISSAQYSFNENQKLPRFFYMCN